MIWETWRRNPSILDSFCPPEHSMASINAINIEFPCAHNSTVQRVIQRGIDSVAADDAEVLSSSAKPPMVGPGSHCSYHYTSDHAKWGISAPAVGHVSAETAASADPNVVCVGGINRMSSQQQRGGGTVCFVHAELHTYMRSLIKTTQDCDVLPAGTPLKMLAEAKTGRTKPASLRISATIVDTPPAHVRGDKNHKSGDLAYGDAYQP